MAYHVLVADDMLVNRKLIKAVLKNMPDIVFHDAEDGLQALECLNEREIDLIILDLMMPGIDGFEVLRRVKGSDRFREIPIIVNSAVDGIDSIRTALELGDYEYFTKPFTLEQIQVLLPMKVKNALKNYEQRKELVKFNDKMMDELKLARFFQHTLIPESKELDTIGMVGKYIPCREIGGDFYDCLQVEDALWFIIADVSGNGVAAAMMSSMVKVMFQSSLRSCHTPDQVLASMNQTLSSFTQEHYYFTAFVGVIRDHVMTYANGGHMFPLHFQGNTGTVRFIEQNGSLVGIFSDAVYESRTLEVRKGDAIILYTDGLLEPSGGGSWDRERDSENISPYYWILNGNADRIMETAIEILNSETPASFQDDVALMFINVK